MASDQLSTKRCFTLLEEERSTKRRKTKAPTGGVILCFNLDGNDVSPRRRSAFTPKRKAEVKGIRRKGACLRCRILKRAVGLHIHDCVPYSILTATSARDKIPVRRASAQRKRLQTQRHSVGWNASGHLSKQSTSFMTVCVSLIYYQTGAKGTQGLLH